MPSRGEPIQGPEQQEIEAVLRYVRPHILEADSLTVLRGGFVGVLPDDGPPLPSGELAELK